MSRTNETKHIEWNETCKCKCILDASVSDNKQRWNEDKYRCEYKELTDKGIYDKGFIWNPSNSECDKSCDVGEYLGYKNCKYTKRLIDKLVEKCSENFDGNEMPYLILNEYKNVFRSCTIYIILLALFFIISLSISSICIYFCWHLQSDINFNPSTETTIY